MIYCNNPIGKFSPRLIKTANVDLETVAFALRVGLLRESLDTFDDSDITNHVPDFLTA